jgi:D-alanyl-lipoteichoic acid acyltransferase DltB (MBOAT superfamily)
MLTFLVSGIWHGSGLQYIFWGLMQGAYQIAGEVLMPIRKRIRALLKIKGSEGFFVLWQRLCCFVLITISWVIFRSSGLREGLSMLKRIFTDITPWVLFDGTIYQFGIENRNFMALILCIILMAVIEHLQEKGNVRELLEKQHLIVRWGIYLGAIALVAVLGVYGPGYSATQFLYGQF